MVPSRTRDYIYDDDGIPRRAVPAPQAAPVPALQAAVAACDAAIETATRQVEDASARWLRPDTNNEITEEFVKVVRDDPTALKDLIRAVGSTITTDKVGSVKYAKPIRIKLPPELLRRTQKNLESSAVKTVMEDNRVLFLDGASSSNGTDNTYAASQAILRSSDLELDMKVPPPVEDIPELRLKTWRGMLAAAVELYRQGKDITADGICKISRRLDPDIVKKVITHKNFGEALELRGVTATWLGLSERQLMALSVLTNYADTRSINSKLNGLGIKLWEFQAWQANAVFRKAYRSASEDLFRDAQAAVNVSLAQNAVRGDLQSQKYFNELSGRWNPAQQAQTDVRSVLTAVAEVLTSTITDPELLRTISSKLSMIIASQGAIAPSARVELE